MTERPNDVIKYTRGVSRSATLTAKGLSYLSEPLLTELEFALFPGDTLGVVGDCSKATLAQILGGRLAASSGQLCYEGKILDPRSAEPWPIALACGEDTRYLQPRKTIARLLVNASAATSRSGLGKDQSLNEELKARIEALIKALGLPLRSLGLTPGELRHDQRHLITLACALVTAPKILVLNGILAPLSLPARAEAMNLLVTMQKEQQLSVVLLSDDLSIIHHLCDRVLILHEGCVAEYGSIREVFYDPQHSYTRSLLADQPRLPARNFSL